MTIFQASELINAEEVGIERYPSGRANVPFLNLRFTHKPISQRQHDASVFSGSGIYGIIFQGRLIYIGSYLGDGGNGVAAYGGDVVQDRWWTHVAGISCRGHRISFARGTLRNLYEDQEFQENHLVRQLSSGDQEVLIRNNGCSVSLNRAKFSARNQDIFLTANSGEILKFFTFVYVRIAQIPDGVDAQSLAIRIHDIEGGLIRDYEPPTNDQHMNRPDSNPVGCEMSPRDFEKLCSERLLLDPNA